MASPSPPPSLEEPLTFLGPHSGAWGPCKESHTSDLVSDPKAGPSVQGPQPPPSLTLMHLVGGVAISFQKGERHVKLSMVQTARGMFWKTILVSLDPSIQHLRSRRHGEDSLGWGWRKQGGQLSL